ncbi:proton-coupled amino acid transporter-like protein CG1139 [Bradysia coprophila]|uniref:proton-coupled amino acid transporter-like protein CG1139 n=1 Tax=Bradysia coprophila TaxID=38358 RepID=UPI00187D846F|nr:proton-coupled amino acid transporter-like protein CG1139 [Bradysia coprophila]XP_037035318.1 proton-coupled amino acid transporter-like protein CG1139 [Bradysia coprophila]XP_037035319.1 proton-coupled amino acid transporter-like protein CG1139 [Bradysia coprophila]XP_037035320.1 proton-coupled amino acid transporter-like protein CG1139 [Bradysia coprophila]XP_037035321.1 proton-coupled amino acid transporter-like protein CG1139 [Bradysia coprophila]
MKDNKIELQDLNAEAPMLNKDDAGEDYDPHLHRDVPDATSNTQTLVHLLKGSLGTGILAMPQAFYYAGYASGVINTIFITFISTYCLLVLAKNQYILCKRHRLPMLSYPISMKMALEEGPTYLRFLSKIAIPFVDGFLIVYQAGICCVYIVFVAENIKEIVDALGIQWNVKVYMVILLIPLILLMCVRNLKLLAPLSLFSNVITFLGVALIFYYFFKDGIAGPSERIAFNSLANFPLFFGTTLFAINAVGVVIAVENNMKTPKSFNMVMSLAMTIICVLYAVFGFVGYLRYGESCKGSVTLNADQTEILAKCIRGIFALATFISYGLQGYVPVSIVWGTYLSKVWEDSDYKIYYEFAVRILIVLITSAVAAAIPFIGLFISLVGALCISVLGIMCPALMEICVLYKDKLPVLTVIKNLFFIIVGIVGLVVGTWTSVRDIIAEYSK